MEHFGNRQVNVLWSVTVMPHARRGNSKLAVAMGRQLQLAEMAASAWQHERPYTRLPGCQYKGAWMLLQPLYRDAADLLRHFFGTHHDGEDGL